MRKRRLLLGPPGCGKTERLLLEMERCLERGIPPQRIAFVSFTRAAIREARNRACERFNLTEDDLPYFRTLHSLCFRQLGLRRSEVFGREAEKELSDLTGEELTGHHSIEGPTLGDRGDALLFLDQYARNTGMNLQEAWLDHGGFDIDWWRLRRFCETYSLLRAKRGLLDFTDMLEQYAEGNGPRAPVDVALMDEVQDFTPLQWRVASYAFQGAQEIQAAGDDDQSIHRWAGASLDGIFDFDGQREVLAKSFRLPRKVHALAMEVSSRISRRWDKRFEPRDDDGDVVWVTRPEEADLSQGKWLIMGRTRRLLKDLEQEAREQGVVYSVAGRSAVDPEDVRTIQGYEALRRGDRIDGGMAAQVLRAMGRKPGALDEDLRYDAKALKVNVEPIWHDALTAMAVDDREYYLACLRRGEKLTAQPRVRIETIHGAKGMQEENVLLSLQTSQRVDKGYELDPDSEHRVFYVGVSRASQNLHILEPRSNYRYQL